MEMVRKDISQGISKDWGVFPGENRGYRIVEGDPLDGMKMNQPYAPYVGFEIHPVGSMDDVAKLLKHMSV